MAVQITKLQREFKWNNRTLNDVNPNLTPEEVVDFHAGQFPELTNAFIKKVTPMATKIVYEVGYKTQTKG